MVPRLGKGRDPADLFRRWLPLGGGFKNIGKGGIGLLANSLQVVPGNGMLYHHQGHLLRPLLLDQPVDHLRKG